jgi:hypothetical protein
MSKSPYQEEKYIRAGAGAWVGGGAVTRSFPQRRRRESLARGDQGEEKGYHELMRKEIEKMREMHKNMMPRNAKEGSEGGGNGGGGMNSRDITGEEFRIVCEELWIDFNMWIKHHQNLTNSANIFWSAISRNLYAILFVGFFAVLFRWYVGAGRDACSYGIGYGVFSFMCEVLRYLGEIVVIMLLSIIGFCVGLLPLVIGVIIYEFNDVFPRGDGEGDDEDDGGEEWDDHQKKE